MADLGEEAEGLVAEDGVDGGVGLGDGALVRCHHALQPSTRPICWGSSLHKVAQL